MKKFSKEDIRRLNFFLAAHWLRPESAIFLFFKLKSLENIVFQSPTLELCCGDGSTMFSLLGGEFDFDYDVFQETNAAAFKHDKFIDIFDHDTELQPPIKTKPSHKIDYGLDWKPELLKKAERLGAYDKLLVHDINDVPLPFEAETLNTVFSNALYWIEDVDKVMKDIHRILHPGGKMVLQLTTPHFLSTLDRIEPYLSPEAMHILDRNRRATMPGGRECSHWEKSITDIGFQIEKIESVFPSQFLMDIWNVGMRPVSHLLIQMAEEMTPQRRLEIKTEWVDIFYELLKPLVSLPNTCLPERAPYLLIVARR